MKVEYAIFESVFVNFIVLKSASLFLREKSKWTLLSAFFCACVQIALQTFQLNVFGHLFVMIGISIVMLCISFKFQTLKKFFKIFLALVLSNFLYAGAIFFFERWIGFPFLTLLCAGCTYLIFVFVIKKFHKKSSIDKFCFDVDIKNKGSCSTWKGFLDSGNFLTDPVTNSPVSLVNFKVFSHLFEDITLADILQKNDKIKKIKNAHYIDLNTLAGQNKILVFEVESLKIGEKFVESATLGLCFKNFDESFDIILSNSLGV